MATKMVIGSMLVAGSSALIAAPPAGCAATLCQEGTICVEDATGAAECITNPCHVTDCPPSASSCVVENGQAVCVTPVVGCAATLCAVGTDCEEDENGQAHCVPQDDGLDVDGYYLMKHDQRRCIHPLCGGYWVNRVNKRKMRCADGTRQESCYVAEVTSDLKPLFFANENLLVKGTPSKKDYGESFGELGTFSLEQSLLPLTSDEALGKFFAVEDNGIRCVTTPCPSLTWYLLNKDRSQAFSSMSFDERLGKDAAAHVQAQIASGETAFVAATRERVNGEKQLAVNQVYNKCPLGYSWHKDACRTEFGCAYPQLTMTLVGGVAPGGEGLPASPSTTISCVDSCEEHQVTGPGTCMAVLQ